ncbi:hypothetical protein CHLRE_03g192350v5 [Chlamydomonas reinhardtii]|uniref:Kelch repeat protein n=1 Tax=Chlamydomonas reinhardtii TaxID=3055 RepID=A8IWE8_CHLRE|nr:uncharacterized protein CHLRE_03g192350v5 [Chlamydomonas reinhardtii]PNW85559.1 hypothetical protein CHLRE_03g192350v5 [Chlamydomonas reinhardtii]|eukprot:XP_001693248.1 predicted protein [Chlamydomonas reinhardtii]
MADCLNGGKAGSFTNLDGTDQKMMSAPAQTRSRGASVCWFLYLSLLTCVAVIAFILGCYSVDKVRNPDYPESALTANLGTVPEGYSVFSLGTGLGYWSQATPMNHSRSDHGVLAVGKYAYLIGGLSDEGPNGTASVLDSLMRYDTETGAMLEMATMLAPRYRFAYAVLDNFIYVMGGTDSASSDAGPLDTVMVYNISGDSWSFGDKLSRPRIDPCGAAVAGKVYVFGGYNESFGSLATVEELDPATATATSPAVWAPLPATGNLAVSRGDCRAVAVDKTIYAVGGTEYYINPNKSCDGDLWVNCYRFLRSVEAFDPVSKTWSPRADMINPRGDFGIEALPGGRIVVAGGERGNGVVNQQAMYEVEEYVAADNIWISKAPLPEARFRDDLAYVNGRVYAFGGAPTCGQTPSDDCAKVALRTVFAYFDVQYPRLYAAYKPANVSAPRAVTSRRMMRR